MKCFRLVPWRWVCHRTPALSISVSTDHCITDPSAFLSGPLLVPPRKHQHRCQRVSPVSDGVTGVSWCHRCQMSALSPVSDTRPLPCRGCLFSVCIMHQMPLLPSATCTSVCVISAHGGISVAIALGPPPGRGVDFSGSGQQWQRWSQAHGISCPVSRDGSAVGGWGGGVA